ncbi:MAG: C25 family cysteine peptidase [Candidatus Methanofastidiosia archaeon]
MREFKSLKPEGLPSGYDVSLHGEEPLVTVEEREGKIVVTYTFLGFFLSDDPRTVEGVTVPFKQATMPHTQFLAESGKPLLPSFGRYVQIPRNCHYSVTVEPGNPVYFDNILILPAQELLVDSKKRYRFEYDREFYNTDTVYPEDLVEVTGPLTIDDYRALLIHVRPLQYNPASKRLTGFSTLTVTIHLEPSSGEAESVDTKMNKKAYGNFFLNPVRGVGFRVGITPAVMGALLAGQGPEFIIIYYSQFREAAGKLAYWKTMRGLSTEIVPLEQVGTSVKAVKEYIRRRKRVAGSRLQYVLLFGDVEVIPAEKITGGPSGHNITDYYYCTEEDPTRSDQYVLPWLSVGRIPVQTEEQGLAVIDRIISYERDPPESPHYYEKMVCAAYFQDKGKRDGREDRAYVKTMETIAAHMAGLGFKVERVYVTSNPEIKEYVDGSQVPETVKTHIFNEKEATKKLIQAVSEGCLLIGHRDHGSATGWVHPAFKIPDLESITSDTPSIFYSINCLTGRFDLKRPRECFAEELLSMEGGAPSLIAATRPSHTWLNDDLMKALFDALWSGVIPTFPGFTASYTIKNNRIGDVLNYAKTYLPLTLSGGRRNIKDHLEIYHVIGDPTLEIWKEYPRTNVIHVEYQGGYLRITMDCCPAESVLTLWCGSDFIRKLEPSSTNITISLRNATTYPLAKEPIIVCFWAPGYRFQRIQIHPKNPGSSAPSTEKQRLSNDSS